MEFLSGVYNGRTTGTAVTLMIRNLNTRSGDYAKTADLLRPGHADYTAYAKYEGFQDARGGGHFSGRITAASVAAGTICETVLNNLGVKVYTHIAECAGVQDAPLSSAAGLVMPDPQPGHFALLDASKEEAMQAAIRAAGCQVGISIRPGTPVEAVFPYLGVVDLILVMSVEPGFGGQKFLPTTPARIAAIRAERARLGCNTLIEVDGGINTVTGPQCIEAGVDWLVAGNSLFRAEDPAAVVRVLHSK